jgi:hypothetical protein
MVFSFEAMKFFYAERLTARDTDGGVAEAQDGGRFAVLGARTCRYN